MQRAECQPGMPATCTARPRLGEACTVPSDCELGLDCTGGVCAMPMITCS